jgi:asparagine synthetase B (glutamine-hydrolysing)
MDQDRFLERNLGRDDRICADHGTEARFPFLDTNVVQFLQGLPLHLVCDFSLPLGQGDKRILRLVAQRLGLDNASGLVKRAIQFGSRISHLSDANRFGSRRKAKGEATVKKNAA